MVGEHSTRRGPKGGWECEDGGGNGWGAQEKITRPGILSIKLIKNLKLNRSLFHI